MLWALRGVTQRHRRGEWTLFIWPQPEHFALLALATAAPVRALQAGRPFREERPFPRFVRQRGNENPAVQGAHGPPTASDRAPDYPEIVATLKRQRDCVYPSPSP